MCDRTCTRQPWRPARKDHGLCSAPLCARVAPAGPRGAPVLGEARDRAHELLVPARAGLPGLPRRGGQRAQGGEQRPQHGRLLVPLRSTCVHLDAQRSMAVTQQQAAAAEREVNTALARAAQVHRGVPLQRTTGAPRCRFRLRTHMVVHTRRARNGGARAHVQRGLQLGRMQQPRGGRCVARARRQRVQRGRAPARVARAPHPVCKRVCAPRRRSIRAGSVCLPGHRPGQEADSYTLPRQPTQNITPWHMRVIPRLHTRH